MFAFSVILSEFQDLMGMLTCSCCLVSWIRNRLSSEVKGPQSASAPIFGVI